jgi:hypothetical protein
MTEQWVAVGVISLIGLLSVLTIKDEKDDV